MVKTRHDFGEKAYIHFNGSFQWISACTRCKQKRHHTENGIQYINDEGTTLNHSIPGCIGSNTKEEIKQMLDDKSVFTGIVTNAARFQSNTPNQSTTPKEDNTAIPLKTGHIYSDSEAWAKELMVTLCILYEEVLTCSLKPETLMMVERKLKSTTWDVWVQNFSSKAEIWKRFKEREEAYRDKFQREASQAFKPQNNEEGNT